MIFVWFQTFPFLVVIFNIVPEWLCNRLLDSLRKWDDGLAAMHSLLHQQRTDIIDVTIVAIWLLPRQ